MSGEEGRRPFLLLLSGYCESHEIEAPRATKPWSISNSTIPGARRAYLLASSLAVVVDMKASSRPPCTPERTCHLWVGGSGGAH